MTSNPWQGRLAVCSWSLQPKDPADLIRQMQAVGLRHMQCALDPVCNTPEVWGDLSARCAAAGLEIVSGMFGTRGEDYSTLESIRRTGGVVPDATWPDNWRHIQRVAETARGMGLRLVTFHAGFLPHLPSDPDFVRLRDRIRQIADWFADRGVGLAMETGQETADTLAEFLTHLDRSNVGINFDPANLILYDKGDPIAALERLGPWLRQCHIKDARRTRQPGTWGEEVVVGTGEVAWPDFFAALRRWQFQGDLAIEREAGTARGVDILTARKVVERVLSGTPI
jgi:L-ribulose-5-phosphate 3-epimerase